MELSTGVDEERARLRAAFETRCEPLRMLAAEFGVSATTLRRRAADGRWVRASGAPSCGRAGGIAPEAADAWRRRMHGRLRRLLERYAIKLEGWLILPGDVSEQTPGEAERYAKTLIALVRCFADLDELRYSQLRGLGRDVPDADTGERQDRSDLDTLLATLERRLDQLAAAGSPPGLSEEPERQRA